MRSATKNGTRPHAASAKIGCKIWRIPAPSIITARNASLSAVSGNARMNGCIASGKCEEGKKTPEKALAEGLEQIRTNDYGAELRAVGANPVHAFAVAFDGKSVSVRAAEG